MKKISYGNLNVHDWFIESIEDTLKTVVDSSAGKDIDPEMMSSTRSFLKKMKDDLSKSWESLSDGEKGFRLGHAARGGNSSTVPFVFWNEYNEIVLKKKEKNLYNRNTINAAGVHNIAVHLFQSGYDKQEIALFLNKVASIEPTPSDLSLGIIRENFVDIILSGEVGSAVYERADAVANLSGSPKQEALLPASPTSSVDVTTSSILVKR